MIFEEELKSRQESAEEIIRNCLPPESEKYGKLAKAMNYSVLAGGKRVRPVLMAAGYELFGGHGTVIEPFMAAIEMIHTASLIHDDLPAIDGDEYRRGMKTTHAVFGEALGVLSGDALENYAYETALQAFLHIEDPMRVIAACRILAEKSGMNGMLGGQAVDVENEKNGILQLAKEELDYIYLHKTAALIEASLMIGAVLAGAGHGEVDCMETIGRKIGLAFQIQDDILDVTSTYEALGKPIGSDEKNNKTTYVTLMGAEAAEKEVRRLTDEAVSLLDTIPGDSEFLKMYLRKLALRDK